FDLSCREERILMPCFMPKSVRAALPRRLRFALLALLLIGSLLSMAGAQQPPARPVAAASADTIKASTAEALALDQQIITDAKSGSEIMANLTYLSDIIGPRLTGSGALKRANEWTAEKMLSYGLSNVHLEAYTIPVGWERGTASARIIEPDNGRTLTVAAMGWTPGTNGKIEGDVVVMTAKNSKELATYKGKLKGAVVLQGPPADVRPITDTSFFPRNGPGSPGGRRDAGPRPDRRYEEMM